jgi:hypothetical protein
MATQPPPGYTQVKITFDLYYSSDEVSAHLARSPEGMLGLSPCTPDATAPGEVTDFASFLAAERTTGFETLKKYLPELKDIGHNATTGGFWGEFRYEVPVPPQFLVDENHQYFREQAEEGLRTLLRRIFYLPPAPPRINALGCFFYAVFYGDGTTWTMAIPDSLPGGGGAKM